MKKKKIRQLTKLINNGKEVNIKLCFAPPTHFRCVPKNNFLEMSIYHHKLTYLRMCVYIAHELGHINTIPQKEAMFVSDYTAEFEANRWAMYRLDELEWSEVTAEFERYIHEMANLKMTDDNEEYIEAATDLILELGLT